MSDSITAEMAEVSTRISIFNLDAVEQSKLWLQVGPTEARRMLVGVLRTALLFGGTIVVDRNQLLEGMFFIAMPPERLAWHLGLEPGAPLPIEVQLLPALTSSSISPGPWRLSNGQQHWGADDELVTEIEANYLAVRNQSRVSSPLIALTGGSYERSSDASQRSHSSAGAVFDKAWLVSDPVVMPQRVWAMRDLEVAKQVRESGREAWLDAMRDGRVQVRSSSGLKPNPIGPELDAEGPPNADKIPKVDELYTALVNLKECDDAACSAKRSGGSEVCQQPNATTRSLVARWLDGEYIEALCPRQLPESLQGDDLAVHRSSALGWWTLAYNRAICARDGLRMLTIYNALPSPSGIRGHNAEVVERAWGLRPPPETLQSRMRARFQRRKRSAHTAVLPIAGDVVTRLAAFTPAEYSRLQAFEAVGSRELLRNPGRRSLLDLVVAIDEITGDKTSRSRRIRSSMWRAALVTIGGLAVVLYDSGFVELSGPGWAVVAFTTAALLAAPWSEFGSLRRMSGSRLQSTLRFRI